MDSRICLIVILGFQASTVAFTFLAISTRCCEVQARQDGFAISHDTCHTATHAQGKNRRIEDEML